MNMPLDLSQAIHLVGWGQLCVLIASALVPLRLDWHRSLAGLPPLIRQLFWVYGGYVVLSITSLGVICILNAAELAAGSGLARAFCAYVTVFWGIRLCLQPVLAAGPFLTTWWLRGGYHSLTALFVSFILVMGWAAFH
jgi:hypothetical protein